MMILLIRPLSWVYLKQLGGHLHYPTASHGGIYLFYEGIMRLVDFFEIVHGRQSLLGNKMHPYISLYFFEKTMNTMKNYQGYVNWIQVLYGKAEPLRLPAEDLQFMV